MLKNPAPADRTSFQRNINYIVSWSKKGKAMVAGGGKNVFIYVCTVYDGEV